MRAVTRLGCAGTLLVTLALSAGCGGVGQTMSGVDSEGQEPVGQVGETLDLEQGPQPELPAELEVPGPDGAPALDVPDAGEPGFSEDVPEANLYP